jgi:AcrR family transcriptional regulator
MNQLSSTKTEDARIKRSKLKLRKSLLGLMINRPIGRITVQELCADAHVNRTTFYKYYKNVDDLLAEIKRSIMDEFTKVAEESLLGEDPEAFIYLVMHLAEKNDDMAQVIFASGQYDFVREIFALFHDQCIRYWQKILNCNDLRTLDLLYYFIVNGIIGIIRRRTDGIIHGDTEELREFVNKVSHYGVYAFKCEPTKE